MVSAFTFKSLSYFELIFMHSIWEWSSFLILHVAVQFSKCRLLKRLSFFPCVWNPVDSLVRDAMDPDGIQWIPSCVMQWILMESSGFPPACKLIDRKCVSLFLTSLICTIGQFTCSCIHPIQFLLLWFCSVLVLGTVWLPFILFIIIIIFLSFCSFLGLHTWDMDVPGLGV